jgi:hypothetical protein
MAALFGPKKPGDDVSKHRPNTGAVLFDQAWYPTLAGNYFANAGNTGNFSTSRASCWIMTVAF